MSDNHGQGKVFAHCLLICLVEPQEMLENGTFLKKNNFIEKPIFSIFCQNCQRFSVFFQIFCIEKNLKNHPVSHTNLYLTDFNKALHQLYDESSFTANHYSKQVHFK